MNVNEVTKKLFLVVNGTTTRKVRKMMREGILIGIKKEDQSWEIDSASVEEYHQKLINKVGKRKIKNSASILSEDTASVVNTSEFENTNTLIPSEISSIPEIIPLTSNSLSEMDAAEKLTSIPENNVSSLKKEIKNPLKLGKTALRNLQSKKKQIEVSKILNDFDTEMLSNKVGQQATLLDVLEAKSFKLSVVLKCLFFFVKKEYHDTWKAFFLQEYNTTDTSEIANFVAISPKGQKEKVSHFLVDTCQYDFIKVQTLKDKLKKGIQSCSK